MLKATALVAQTADAMTRKRPMGFFLDAGL